MAQTYWNGEVTACRQVRVRVGHSPQPTWWCAGMEGTIRRAIEVQYRGNTFYLDNENGSGWEKVTSGKGGPRTAHLQLPDDSEVV